MYQWLAEEGTGGCLCMFFSPTSPKNRAIKMEKQKNKKQKKNGTVLKYRSSKLILTHYSEITNSMNLYLRIFLLVTNANVLKFPHLITD